jgi:hypothetical protein
MTALDRLLAQLEKRGLGVKPGAEPGQLLLTGPAAEKTPEVMAAVTAFKPQLLERFGRREPAPAAKPVARPAAAPVVEGHEVIRSGACRATGGGRLAWATYRAGGWYWFEETDTGRGYPPAYRVYGDGGADGWAVPSVFRAMFAEDAG